MAGAYKCHYKGCVLAPLSAEQSRVEVCTVLPSGQARREEYAVDWTRRGEATFHGDCWNALVKSAWARSNENAAISLCATERTMIKEAGKTAEYHASSEKVKAEAARIVQMIQNSHYCVVFTGAGISTSAGIGDFRGKSGKWTEQAREKVAANLKKDDKKNGACGSSAVESSVDKRPPKKHVPYKDLRPTYTHEGLVRLVELGHVKHIISQNCDGLHRLSGVSTERLSELHGNVYIEYCERCGHRYERSFVVRMRRASNFKRCKHCHLTHTTERKCQQQGCNQQLHDTVINFGDPLEDHVLDRARCEAEHSDLMISLGSTMAVSPACHLVTLGQQPIRMVICNRQETDMDDYCNQRDPETGQPLGSRVFGDCDDLMKLVMQGILGKEDCTQWENEREERMLQYQAQRWSP